MTRSTGTKNRRPRVTVALVSEALQQAAQDAIEVHRRAGQPLVDWKDGKPVLVSPESVDAARQPSKRRRRKSS
jgi:hypothetical protein